MPLLIGLTGGVACGKTTVTDLFKMHGIPIIDADEISRELTAPNAEAIPMIVDAFGQKVLDHNGHLNRPALRKLIFSVPTSKQTLEAILHPLIRKQIHRQIKINTAADIIVLSVPLLFEANMQDMVQRILVIDCPITEQLKRLQDRDNIDPDLAQAMLAAQIGPELRLQSADDIIDNSGDINSLRSQVDTLVNFYQSLEQQK